MVGVARMWEDDGKCQKNKMKKMIKKKRKRKRRSRRRKRISDTDSKQFTRKRENDGEEEA